MSVKDGIKIEIPTNQTIALMKCEKFVTGESIIKGYENWERLLQMPEYSVITSFSRERSQGRKSFNAIMPPIMIRLSAAKAGTLLCGAMTRGEELGLVEIVELTSIGTERVVHSTIKLFNTSAVGWSTTATRVGQEMRAILYFTAYEVSYEIIDQAQHKIGKTVAGQSQAKGEALKA